MTRGEILQRIRDTMVEMFELDPAMITMDARLMEDLDLDSIDAIDLAVKMQEMVGRRVDEAALRKVRTIGDVVEIIIEMLGARA